MCGNEAKKQDFRVAALRARQKVVEYWTYKLRGKGLDSSWSSLNI